MQKAEACTAYIIDSRYVVLTFENFQLNRSSAQLLCNTGDVCLMNVGL